MGRLKVIKTGPLATIQDFGRFGYRKFGIPQSGAMDKESMIAANRLVGNSDDFPVVEFALSGLILEVLEEIKVSMIGAEVEVNGRQMEGIVRCSQGDIIKISPPRNVYAYLGVAGKLEATEDFGSVSTYTPAGFGGIRGRALQTGDLLNSIATSVIETSSGIPDRSDMAVTEIRTMKGPEWGFLKELPDVHTFTIDGSSNRMGIRLAGSKLEAGYKEIASSAVIPGTIQLPADGHPIVLMRDCQTTGGYPRIGNVIEEDLGKLAQLRPGKRVKFILTDP